MGPGYEVDKSCDCRYSIVRLIINSGSSQRFVILGEPVGPQVSQALNWRVFKFSKNIQIGNLILKILKLSEEPENP